MKKKVFNDVTDILEFLFSSYSGDFYGSTELSNELGADSLDRLYILEELEKRYSIHIEDSEMEKCHTIDDIVELVMTKIDAVQ